MVKADGGTVNPVTLIAQSATGRGSEVSNSATFEYVPKPLSITYSVTLTMLCIAKISVTDSNMDNIVLFTEFYSQIVRLYCSVLHQALHKFLSAAWKQVHRGYFRKCVGTWLLLNNCSCTRYKYL